MQKNPQNFKPARAIKFRAWNHEDKEMLADIHDGMMIQMNTGELGFYDDDGNFQPCRYSLMQFTGQKDKESNEIYDGDIINIHAGNPYDVIEGNHIVKWDLTGWYIERCDGVDYTDVDFGDLALYNFTKASDRIGNIYENPELITGAVAV